MSARWKAFLTILFISTMLTCVYGQDMCPTWPGPGSVVTDPLELSSQNGVLTVNLTMRTLVDSGGVTHYCYWYDDTTEAPTLRVNPGDTLIFNLTNDLPPSPAGMQRGSADTTSGDPCAGGPMTISSTNVHYHGLNIPPTCHQDEVIKTTIQPGDPTFQYKIQIPKNDPPGLYWYHPHIHMFTAAQVVGGASGALIIGGLEKMRPEVAGLPERVLIVRQFNVPSPQQEAQTPLDKDDTGLQLSLNYVPDYINLRPAVIQIKPGEKQLWRVLNSTSTQFLALQLQGNQGPRNLLLVGLDGVPLKTPKLMPTVTIPPAGRAEFVVEGPPADAFADLVNIGFDTGPGGDPNPPKTLASIDSNANAPEPPVHLPGVRKQTALNRFANLANITPIAKRKLYFSEKTSSVTGTPQFFITVDGQKERLYDPDDPPAIVTRQGAVEDWTIENRSLEVHAFHIHQIHFLVLDKNGQPTDHVIRDTVQVPYWTGKGPYPSVTLRMDFRDPETVGTFLYHCHIPDHEDNGMMAKIKVLPK